MTTTPLPDSPRSETASSAPLHELTLAVAAAKQPDEVYEAALTCLELGLGVSRASVLLFDRAGVMRFKAWRNLSDGYRASVEGHSPWGASTTDARPVVVPDVGSEPSLEGLRDTIEGEGIHALAFIPLQLGTRLLGKFMLYYDEPHDFGEAEVLTAETIAAHVAFALDQQAHREVADRARQVLESIGVAVYTTDAKGVITFYNEEAAALWGRRPEIGVDRWSGAARLYWPDGTALAHDECPMAVALRTGAPARGYEAIAERPDGSRVNFIPYPTPILDSDGAVLGGVNVLVDITSRKRAEEALHERETSLAAALAEREQLLRERERTIALYELNQAQLASLIEASGALISTKQEADAVEQIFGIERDLLRADAYAMWLYVQTTDEWKIIRSRGLSPDYLAHAAIPSAGQRVLREPMIVEDVAAEPRLADLLPRYRAEGIASMFVCALTNEDDISGTVAFYYRSPHKFTDLEVRVGTALANLASASLHAAHLFEQNEQARTRLREANEKLVGIASDLRTANAAKDEFLSLVSHELKTPLTTIRGNAGVLFKQMEHLDADTRSGALADIVSESDRLHRIIENLLLLARAEQGEIEAEPVLVVRIVNRVIARHREREPHRAYEIEEEGDPRPVIFSEASLEQVVENLLSNAEKYSSRTSPIVIRFARDEREVTLRVLDAGVGLEEADVERLFDPFYRSESTRRRAEGLGIGLAVCKRLVEAHGGRMWARRRAEGGSEFGFAVPVADDDEQDQPG